jgi:protein-S-isoprenylcysteine O-methyltransferase Ste14
MENIGRIPWIVLLAAWVLWGLPFLIHRAREKKRPAQVTVTSSNWGIGLQMVGYFLAWASGPRPKPPAALLAGIFFAGLAVALSWTGIRSLGKQLRIQAGLYADHELVRSGPYRIVRHPIYAGMLSMFLAVALIWGAWILSAIGLAFMIVGTEIRVRLEDGLLASRFGHQFQEFKASTAAYIPFLR